MRLGDLVRDSIGDVYVVVKVFPGGYMDLKARDRHPHVVFVDYYPEILSAHVSDYKHI